jgi:co-chaperonin GroES (HSP10)
MKTSCPLLPTADTVVIINDAPKASVGSIVLAPAAERNTQRGTVVAVGPDFADELDVGSKIVYSRWLTEVEVGDARYLLIRGEDVLAVLA